MSLLLSKMGSLLTRSRAAEQAIMLDYQLYNFAYSEGHLWIIKSLSWTQNPQFGLAKVKFNFVPSSNQFPKVTHHEQT